MRAWPPSATVAFASTDHPGPAPGRRAIDPILEGTIRMTITKTGLTALVLAGVVASATAFAADPIETRKATMKAIGGAFGGVMLKMVKGQKPYDAKEAEAALQTMIAKAGTFDVDTLFPKGSGTGGDTAASPKIWTDGAGFRAAMAKMKETLPAQADNVGKGVGGLKVAIAAIGRTCKSCHDDYRLERD